VVPITDEDVLAKIHQNYRMTYIKDVILLRYLDGTPHLSSAASPLS
jgi:hypothetical protein